MRESKAKNVLGSHTSTGLITDVPRTLSQPGYAPDCNSRFYQIQASVWSLVRFIYDIDHMYALRIHNTSESDPRSYEAIKAVCKESPENVSR